MRDWLVASARLQPGVGFTVLALQTMIEGPPLVAAPLSTAWLLAAAAPVGAVELDNTG